MGSQLSIDGHMSMTTKVNAIYTAIQERDLQTLRELSRTDEGLLYDRLRRAAWPLLLHTDHGSYLDEKANDKQILDGVQIAKDIERSLYYYPQGMSAPFKEHKQKELRDLIMEVLWRNPKLNYYQGFHDICACFLLVLGKKDAIPAAENVALFFLRDAMLETFDPISKLLNLMNALLDMADPQLRAFLDRCNILPYYALSWILTWFSHDLEDYHKVVRLFDLFIASAPSMPLYVSCAITCLRRKEIMAMDPDFVHTAVTNIPPNIDIEATIRLALVLEKKYPILSVQKHSGQWVHEHSAANTFESDWAALQYNQEPNHVRVEQYLGKGIPKEEWEDEVLTEVMQRRRSSTTSKT
ncbi:unnamed protein product [Umbelopsis ramanniana]